MGSGKKSECNSTQSSNFWNSFVVTETISCSEDDEREEAISSGGLDLIVVPGLGFTKVGL